METSRKSPKTRKSENKLNDREIDEKRKKNRERARRHREKMTEEKKAETRAKYREYKRKMKEAGVIKTINQLSNREQRLQRIKWKEYTCNYRRRQSMKKAEEIVEESTTLGREGTPREQAGEKVAKQNYTKIRREIQLMKTKIKEKDKKIEALRKRVYRLQKKQNADSVKKIIGRKKVSPAIRKNLLQSYALMSGLSPDKKVKDLSTGEG